MGEMNAYVEYSGELSAKVMRANGDVEDLGVISKADAPEVTQKPVGWKLILLLAVLLLLFALVILVVAGLSSKLALIIFMFGPFAIVTTTGVTYMAADFAGGGSSPHIGAFNFHDNGTGTNAAATSDTALQTPTGGSRVSGTQSQPGTTNIYRTVATISFSSSFAITEWGLFSASSSGTLWDRRVFSAINVASGDSIQYTYNLTVNAGGT